MIGVEVVKNVIGLNNNLCQVLMTGSVYFVKISIMLEETDVIDVKKKRIIMNYDHLVYIHIYSYSYLRLLVINSIFYICTRMIVYTVN